MSEPCKTGAWVYNPEFNVLLNACLSPLCKSTCNSSADALQEITDGSFSTTRTAWMNQGIGSTWARVPIPTGPTKIVNIYTRGVWPINTTLSAIHADGSKTLLASLGPTFSYKDLFIDVPVTAPAVTELSLQSNTRDGVMRGFCYGGIGDCKTMSINELAARSRSCYEQLTLDLGLVQIVQKLLFQFSGFVTGNIYTSIDGLNFLNRSSLSKFSSTGQQQSLMLNNVAARYVRFRFARLNQ